MSGKVADYLAAFATGTAWAWVEAFRKPLYWKGLIWWFFLALEMRRSPDHLTGPTSECPSKPEYGSTFGLSGFSCRWYCG